MYAISTAYRNGIILCKRSQTEFIGPGAAISQDLDPDLWGAIALGNLDLRPIATLTEQRQAYQFRSHWSRWLQQTTNSNNSLHNALNLIAGFDAFFGSQLIRSLPLTVLARLAAVPYSTLLQACRIYYGLSEADLFSDFPCSDFPCLNSSIPTESSVSPKHATDATAKLLQSRWSWLSPTDLGLTPGSPPPPLRPSPNVKVTMKLAHHGFKALRNPYGCPSSLSHPSWLRTHQKHTKNPYNLAKVI